MCSWVKQKVLPFYPKMYCACYHHLKDPRCIRKFLSEETVALLPNSVVISLRIDYCNSLLNGINKYNVAKLQKIQNALCRIAFRQSCTGSASHITSCLNILSLCSRQLNSPNILIILITTSSLTHRNWLSFASICYKKAIGR